MSASSRQGRSAAPLVLTVILLAPAGCQQRMARQPSYRPLEPSTFFADGQSARPLPAGTVARGQLRDDRPLFTGKIGDGQALADYDASFPFPVTREVLERGRERYTIFCAVCHDAAGTGKGKIVERGYTRPPSFITDYSRGFERRRVKVLLRDAPAGYYFEVISKGYGAMPDYAAQVPPPDRWAIITYVRALQLSQYARPVDLPESERQAARSALEAQRERGSKSSR